MIEKAPRRSFKPRPTKKSNPIPMYIGIAVAIVVVIGSYFAYSNHEKQKYVSETLGYQASFSAQVEKGEFQKSLTNATAIQNRIDARKDIFTSEQITSFSNAVKNLKRQIEIKEILEKLKFDAEGESKKSLVKLGVIKSELNGKIEFLKPEMNAFLITFATTLQDQITETQQNLFREDYRRVEKEWDKQIEEGKFLEAAKANKEYLEAAIKPNDAKMNAFIEKAFPIANNKFDIQRKLFEEGLALQNKGLMGQDHEYVEAVKSLDAFIRKVPLEYPQLQKELKKIHTVLSNSQRNRMRSKINKLPFESEAEKVEIETKAFNLEIPAVSKTAYTKSAKADLEKLYVVLKRELPFFTLEKENINESENFVHLIGKEYTVEAGYGSVNNMNGVIIQINGVKMICQTKVIADQYQSKYILNHAYETARKLKLIDEACQNTEQIWTISALSGLCLGLVAEVTKNGVITLLIDDKLFEIEKIAIDKNENVAQMQKFKTEAKDFASAISKHDKIDKDIAKPIALFATAIHENIDPNHFLTRQFAQLALANGYFENVIPNMPADLKEKASKLKSNFEQNIIKKNAIVSSTNKEGSEIKIFTSISGLNSQWVYDKEKNETAFVRLPLVVEMDSPNNFTTRVSSAIIYSGRHEKEPANDPIRIESRHITGGILASYDYLNKKFQVDQKKWDQHIITVYPRYQELFGTASWAYPPHVLNLDEEGNVLEMFVPNGRFALVDYSTLKTEEEKVKAKNEWLDHTASVLKSSGELHLIFKYFAKYTFDSPIPNMNNLIGNNSERGDYHQTVYETLERNLGKKMLCDCDDLAEVYAEITRRQGRISYVMMVPGHATCGWIDKLPDGYAMNFLDTGPPRRIIDKTLDKAIEKGVKAYDQRNLMGFNARYVSFLFRFAGEQVRQPYYLDAKVMVDNDYGCAMVDVQESWHFHLFLQGVQTMEEILKTDKDSANYFELSGLYREMGLFDEAARIYKLGLDQLDKKDEFALIQSTMTYLNYLQKSNPAKVLELTKENAEKLKKVNAPGGAKQLVDFDLANFYLVNKKPVDAFKTISSYVSDNVNNLNERFINTLVAIVNRLYDKTRNGQTITEEEKAISTRLEVIIKKYYDTNHFKPQDDYNGTISKYSGLFSFYISKYGWSTCLEKLKTQTFPSNFEKNHTNRSKATEDEDWNWIRLNLGSYYSALFQSLGKKRNGQTSDDIEEDAEDAVKELPTPEMWKEAMKYQDLMENAYKVHISKGMEKQSLYIILLSRLLRGVVEKNDKLVDATLDKMKSDNWTSFYRMVSDTISGMSGIVPKDDYLKLFQKFASRNPPKQHFMGIAYKALANKKYDIALAIADATAIKFKGDAKLEKEIGLFRAFVNKQKTAK